MKHPKSSLKDLRELFERSITVRDIASPLCSFDGDCSVETAKNFMDDKGFNVIGVRKDGLIHGYARKSDMIEGKLQDYIIDFGDSERFLETTSLIEVLKAFEKSHIIFVLVFGKVGGIVTRGDLQKYPVMMWLFGIISLIEMQLLRIIRNC